MLLAPRWKALGGEGGRWRQVRGVGGHQVLRLPLGTIVEAELVGEESTTVPAGHEGFTLTAGSHRTGDGRGVLWCHVIRVAARFDVRSCPRLTTPYRLHPGGGEKTYELIKVIHGTKGSYPLVGRGRLRSAEVSVSFRRAQVGQLGYTGKHEGLAGNAARSIGQA